MHQDAESEISGDSDSQVFSHEQVEENNKEDDWDDSQLIREYDRVVAKAKEQVIQKLKVEMKLTDEEIKEVFGDVVVNGKNNKNHKDTSSQKQLWTVGSACRTTFSEDGRVYEAEIIDLLEPNKCIIKYIGYNNKEEVYLSALMPSFGKNAVELQEMTALEDNLEGMRIAEQTNKKVQEQMFRDKRTTVNGKNKKKKKPKWTVGSACRTAFSEDGKEYEAEIIKLVDPHKCIVRFIGYNNEEEVYLRALFPSFGEEEIQHQKMAAFMDIKQEGVEEQSTYENIDSSECRSCCQRRNRYSDREPTHYRLPRHRLSPPPPPPPPNFLLPMEDEALNAMLMSWYMCGYYIGYNQARREDC